MDKKTPGTPILPAMDNQFHAYIRDRAHSKLGKYAKQIQSLKIGLKGTTTDRGEAWVACRITIDLRPGGPLVVERSAFRPGEAFDHSIGVAERMVRRILQKLRHRSG